MGITRRIGLSGFEYAEARRESFCVASSEESLVERLDVRVVLY
jgi:hypothetical protein